ncbi:hypothetical protein, partial [Acidithiobacillus sulfurivorans]|uniref:hypothetical protein n=1 Tax=Acidithiobacillus sulfurivorans TaxID=1958756 RepID=UPI001C07D79C
TERAIGYASRLLRATAGVLCAAPRRLLHAATSGQILSRATPCRCLWTQTLASAGAATMGRAWKARTLATWQLASLIDQEDEMRFAMKQN